MAVVEALGLMTHILNRAKLPSVLEKLIPSIMGHFKGKFTSDMLPFTQVCPPGGRCPAECV